MVHITLFDAPPTLLDRIARPPAASLWENVVRDEASFRAYPRYLLIENDALSPIDRFEGALVRMRGSYERSGQAEARVPVLEETRGIYAVFCYARDGLDDEFNEWYDRVHLPQALDLGVYEHGTRYRLATRPADPFVAPYFSLYETRKDPRQAFDRWLEFRTKWSRDPDWARLLGFIASGGFARMVFPG